MNKLLFFALSSFFHQSCIESKTSEQSGLSLDWSVEMQFSQLISTTNNCFNKSCTMSTFFEVITSRIEFISLLVEMIGMRNFTSYSLTTTIIITKEFSNEIIHASFFSSVITFLAAMAVQIKMPKKADDACTRSLIVKE